MTTFVRRARKTARKAIDIVSSPVGSVLRFKGTGPVVGLTFDDGPDPEVTLDLLDVLSEANASATFFMLCSRVRRYPEIARSVRDAGHEIALHGLDHRRLTTLTPSQAATSVTEGKKDLEAALGVRIRWFRPPYGAHDLRIWRTVRALGMQMVLWGPSLHDWAVMTEAERWRGIGAKPGDIVLGHDGIAGAIDGVEAPPTPDLDRPAWAAQVIAHYASQGLSGVTLGDLARRGRPVRGARWTP
jgi:peptidoglycan/xylan/chitin deacetylase (PgdA/CDA1 family)